MNLHRLRSFLTVTEQRSFTSAARLLHLTQPAVSNHVRQLEKELHIKLIDRTRNPLATTAAGDVLAAYSAQLLRLARQAERAVRNVGHDHDDGVTIGATATVASYFLPGILDRFWHRHPDVQVDVQVSRRDSIIQDVADRRLPLGVVTGDVSDERLSAQHIAEDRLVLIASANHALAGHPRPRPVEIRGERFFVREPGSHDRRCFEDMRTLWHLDSRLISQISNAETIKGLVAGGHGIALVSGRSVSTEIDGGHLATLAVSPMPVPRPVTIVHVRDHTPATLAESIIDACGAPGRVEIPRV